MTHGINLNFVHCVEHSIRSWCEMLVQGTQYFMVVLMDLLMQSKAI